MDLADIEFLAESERLEIIPNFNHGKMYLIEGEIGPFRAGIPVLVPLWLAVNLRQRQRCRIIPPNWMSAVKFEEVKENEMQSKLFTKIDSLHYMEMLKLLVDTAPEDVTNADEIRTVVKDVWDIRMAKLRSSINSFVASEGTYAKIDNLTATEINTVRPFLPEALDQLHRLRKSILTVDDSSQQP